METHRQRKNRGNKCVNTKLREKKPRKKGPAWEKKAGGEKKARKNGIAPPKTRTNAQMESRKREKRDRADPVKHQKCPGKGGTHENSGAADAQNSKWGHRKNKRRRRHNEKNGGPARKITDPHH